MYIKTANDKIIPVISLRDFVGEFKGLRRDKKKREVAELIDAPNRADLTFFQKYGETDHDKLDRLLSAMKNKSDPVLPGDLGKLGKERMRDGMAKLYEASGDFKYKHAHGTDESTGFPWSLEIGFAVKDEDAKDKIRDLVVGFNWSPCLRIPFDALLESLQDARCDATDPVALVVHLTCPSLPPTDIAKSRYDLPPCISDSLKKTMKEVCKDWTKLKAKSERNENREINQRELDKMRGKRDKNQAIKDAAFKLIPQAYEVASDHGKLPATVRQIMYSAREQAMKLGLPWGCQKAFTTRHVPDFVRKNLDLCKEWDVVYDSRGHIEEPHTQHRVELGTVNVRDYVRGWTDSVSPHGESIAIPHKINTIGPANRYRFVLFIEKEGFNSLLRRENRGKIRHRDNVNKGHVCNRSSPACRGLDRKRSHYPRSSRLRQNRF